MLKMITGQQRSGMTFYRVGADYFNCDGCQKPVEKKYSVQACNNLVHMKFCSKCWHDFSRYLLEKGFKKVSA